MISHDGGEARRRRVPLLLRLLGIHDATIAERRATTWVAAMFLFTLASTSLLRPLRDQFGVDQGVAAMPRLYTWTLVATVVGVLPFWWLANRVPSRRFVPATQFACIGAVVALAIALLSIGDYDWKQVPWLGEVFWGGFSALNVILPSLVWIHAVEHFSRAQGRRLFGLVAVGGTTGAVMGSWATGSLAKTAPPWTMAVLTAVLITAALVCFVASQRSCRELHRDGAPRNEVARGGTFAALPMLVREPRVRALAIYMLFVAVLATTFAASQTAILGAEIDEARKQHEKLANIEFWSQATVLALQLFCTGRLLQRLPLALFLVALPCASVLGLSAVAMWPTVAVISAVQIARRGVQHAFDRPGREVLYTPLDLETKHKAKFVLETFVFRLGDLAGAIVIVQLAANSVVAVSIGVALAWVGLGTWLGRRHGADAAAAQRASIS